MPAACLGQHTGPYFGLWTLWGRGVYDTAGQPCEYSAWLVSILAFAGMDIRTQRWTVRRHRLEHLVAGYVRWRNRQPNLTNSKAHRPRLPTQRRWTRH